MEFGDGLGTDLVRAVHRLEEEFYRSDARFTEPELRPRRLVVPIDDVLLGGATPTEILMGLRSTLDSLLGTEPGLMPALVRQVRETREALDSALG